MRCLILSLLCALGLATAAAPAQTYKPDFDPSRIKGPRAGAPGQILVLGTPHLSTLPDSFNPDNLKGLLSRLSAWKPQAIAIEAVSGVQCDFMRRYSQRYRDSVSTYCWDPAPAQTATGLDVPAATVEAQQLLAHWPAEPSAAQRRHLAAVFLAGAELTSACVQWLRLPEEERHAGDGLSDALVAELNMRIARRNENYLIAAPLAALLGLEQVYAMDDHTADVPVESSAGADAAEGPMNAAMQKRSAMEKELHAQLGSPQTVPAAYRTYNAPWMAKLAFDSDFGVSLERPDGRGELVNWETRNLRMASNIHELLQVRPDRRVLVIVGASHKGYLESYLNQMHELRIDDVEAVLH